MTDHRSPAPQADRHLLALHELRQRQLQTAFLHGSRRNWRDRRRIWPAVLTAVLIVALLVTVVAVLAAFRRQQELDASTGRSDQTVAVRISAAHRG